MRPFHFLWKFIKKYIFCIRDVWVPLEHEEDSCDFDKNVWFAEGKYLYVHLTFPYMMRFSPPEHFEYKINSDTIAKTSHAQKTLMDGCRFCGCFKVELEPEYVIDSHLTCEVTNLKEGQSHFQEMMNIINKYRNDYQISIIHFCFSREFAYKEFGGDPENITEYVEPVLKTAEINVPLLVLVMSEADPRVFLEHVFFDNLILTSIPGITLTPKVLACDFLYLNAPIINFEALQDFKGIGLVLKANEENNISFDNVDMEIELWKTGNRSSTLQFYGVVQKSEVKPILDKYIGKFSETKFIEDSMVILKILPLDDKKNSAIFVLELLEYNAVCFVTGGWVKWLNVTRLFYPK